MNVRVIKLEAPPPIVSGNITLSGEELSLLRYITWHTRTIPEAIAREHNVPYAAARILEIKTFITKLHQELEQAGVPL
jgi:hypothetical protein